MFDTFDKILICIGVIITMTLAGIIICVIVLSPERTQNGTLYFIDRDDPICTGTLRTTHHSYANDTYRFDCDDGRAIEQLTNFILK